MRFIAIDLETANPRMSSICQIGIVAFEGGKEVASESLLIDPEDYFDPFCTAIHGLTADDVQGARRFRDIHARLCEWTSQQIVVCHTHFDRVALHQACGRDSREPLPCNWLDSAMVARRTWPEFSKSGYGLANLARHFGITFKHHDALEDARTAGLILLKAIEESGFEPSIWIDRCNAPLKRVSVCREGNDDGSLVGESIVFTGSLQVPRREAADLAHESGARVESNVTKQTTLLVVGDQDIEKLNGQMKSSKHRKAEELIGSGQSIRILGEADFVSLCQTADAGRYGTNTVSTASAAIFG